MDKEKHETGEGKQEGKERRIKRKGMGFEKREEQETKRGRGWEQEKKRKGTGEQE